MALVFSLIPARGGSKGIPRKNISPLAGKPLLAHSIEYSLNSPKVDRTIVSTDDPEIAEIAKNFGAETPFLRPTEFAQDDTTDLPVFLHAIEWFKKNEDIVPDLWVQLRPTTPLRPPGLIENAIKLIDENPEADCVRTVQESPSTPYKMWKWESKYLKPFVQLEGRESFNMPRQALPKVFNQDGILDIVKTSICLEKNSLTGDHILPLEINGPFLTVDIDLPVDLIVAEVFYEHNKKLVS
jgi:CMP-N,N'-diacetyllegionaminic acid synthase